MVPYESTWQATLERIAAAARAAGRRPADVRLLAASKTVAPAAVRALHRLGQRAFGENYVQEAAAKRAALADLDIEWHLIGPLQGNKARLAAETFDWVETIDRLKIAERLGASRDPARGPLSVLIQVNASAEVTKSGVSPPAAVDLARAVARVPGLRLRGIMGIPAASADAARTQYAVLRQCFEQCRAAGLTVDTLSMGMSADLELAIAEGSTEVRVGTALFGPRPTRAG